MDTLKPKNSKLIRLTVREGFFTFWEILAHSVALEKFLLKRKICYTIGLQHATYGVDILQLLSTQQDYSPESSKCNIISVFEHNDQKINAVIQTTKTIL